MSFRAGFVTAPHSGTGKESDVPVSYSDIEEWWKHKHLLRHVMRGASDGPMETNEGGETARRQCFFFVSPSRKFPRLPHDTIPNAEATTVARRPPARVICDLPLRGKTWVIIFHSPAQGKQEF